MRPALRALNVLVSGCLGLHLLFEGLGVLRAVERKRHFSSLPGGEVGAFAGPAAAPVTGGVVKLCAEGTCALEIPMAPIPIMAQRVVLAA